MTAPPPLRAKTTVAVAAPLDVVAKLRDHFMGHGDVSGSDEHWSAAFGIGVAEAKAGDGSIEFRVSASDPTSLSYLQWSVAEHVCEFTPGEAPNIVWNGGVEAGAALPYFREMHVVRTSQITPRMRRVTLAGHDLQRFSHDGMHIRLLLPERKGMKPVWPVMGADGRQAWPDGPRPVARVYTIRRIDVAAGEIDIDFVLHEGDEMPGACFGLEAVSGDLVGLTGPGGGELRVADWYLLAGDETALPAIGRMLEEMPANKKIAALIEIADDAERQDLRTNASLELHWLSREGRAGGTTNLLADAVEAAAFPEDGSVFVWAGCEHTVARTIRAYLREDRELSRHQMLVAAYWRRGTAGEIEHSE